MHPLEQEIQSIDTAFRLGNLSGDDRNYLIQEIRDIRAAQECAGNEAAFRYVVQICNLALGVM
jgi:hypothetical protein